MDYNSNIDDKTYKKLVDNFELLCNILKQNSESGQLKVDLSKIEKIINENIPDALGKNAPENFYELYTDFKSEYEKFRDFILYDRLIGKNIVALGGGFSSGKSSFLNALMGNNIGKNVRVLPAAIDPSTSVPTYIVRGDNHEVMGINIFDTIVNMKLTDINKIAHGFGELKSDDDGTITDEVKLGHVLESIFLSTPWHQYDNIAFLDTPGYSKPDSLEYSVKTDEQIARGQLNSSNYILWFVQADAGTITMPDIEFIKTLRADIPKLIVVNKADKKNERDLRDVINNIKDTLDRNGVQYLDVCAFSSRMEQVGDKKLKTLINADTKKIKKQIDEWDRQVYESNFARNFKRLFIRCREFYDEEIEDESRKLNRLNTSITRLLGEDIDNEILGPLQEMVKEAQANVNSLKDIQKKLRDLQDEFFTEIKLISDLVGIAMPEPSEIELLQEATYNPLEMVLSYKKSKGIISDDSMTERINAVFEGAVPVINRRPGGSEYKNSLHEAILEICDLEPEDIHINDICTEIDDGMAELSRLVHC